MADNRRVVGGAEMRALARDLRAAGDEGKKLRKRLRATIVAEIKPMQADLKRAASEIPVKGGGRSTGLRKALGKATKIRVLFSARSASATLEVDPKKMPAGQQSLPGYMEGTTPRWRHPVFGHPGVTWQNQKAHPYFYKTVDPKIPGAVVAIEAAAATTAEEIERGTI